MHNPSTTEKLGNYNLEKALYLLGPVNHASFVHTGVLANVDLIIQHLVIVLFRTINYIFGDHQWYNNKTAHDIVTQYYNTPVGSQATRVKVDNLFNELQLRSEGYFQSNMSDPSIAEEPELQLARRNFISNQQRNRPQSPAPTDNPQPPAPTNSSQPSTPANRHQPPVSTNSSQPSTPANRHQPPVSTNSSQPSTPANRYQPPVSTNSSQPSANQNVSYHPSRIFQRNLNPSDIKECGNISMLNVWDELERTAQSVHLTKSEKLQMAQETEVALLGYRVQLVPEDVTSEQANEAYNNLTAFFSPRIGPVDDQAIDSDYNEKYADAYDPHELFALAALDAANELEIPKTRLLDSNFVRSDQWLSVCKLAVFNLLLQSKLCIDDCGGPYIRLNENTFTTMTRYQKPIIVYERSSEKNTYEPQAVFATDIFSSTYVGCDPDGAKRLMHKLQKEGLLEDFKHNFQFSNQNHFYPETDQAILFDLLSTMAEQVNNRYSAKMMPMLTAFLNNEKLLADKSFENLEIPEGETFEEYVPYDEYVNSAQTTYQLFLLTFIWCTQKLASAGLINEDDPYGGDGYIAMSKVICSETLLRIISRATIKDEFTLQLSDTITLPCGKFFSHEPLLEEPNVLQAVERFVQNELCGNGTVDDPYCDPIKLISMFAALNPEEKKLFSDFYSENYIRMLYALKGIPENEMVDVNKTKIAFESLNDNQKAAFRSLAIELSNLFIRLNERYFNHMLRPIFNFVNISENARPSILRPSKLQPVDLEPIEKEMELNYLDKKYRELVVLDKRPLNPTPPKKLIEKWENLPGNDVESKNGSGIALQFRKITNDTITGNCMYGALARVIFGKNVLDHGIDRLCTVLREAAAKYMLAHKDQYEATMYDPLKDVQGKNETDQAFDDRMKATHAKRLVSHCDQITKNYKYGTDREIGAIAAIFGVEVKIFNIEGRAPMEIKDGIIQPNTRVGNNFIGKQPIQLFFSGNHFYPVEAIS